MHLIFSLVQLIKFPIVQPQSTLKKLFHQWKVECIPSPHLSPPNLMGWRRFKAGCYLTSSCQKGDLFCSCCSDSLLVLCITLRGVKQMAHQSYESCGRDKSSGLMAWCRESGPLYSQSEIPLTMFKPFLTDPGTLHFDLHCTHHFLCAARNERKILNLAPSL